MKKLFDFLKTNNYTLATCESFTGGFFASEFTNIPGSSSVFVGGFVCYTNAFKIKQVGVPEQVIKNFSEVSKEALGAMLEQTQSKLQADVCFAFTGFAPPIDKSNKASGLSYLGFKIGQQQYIYEFYCTKNIARLKYKKLALKFILKKFENIVRK
ncbi:competence damage-inducible protein A [Spiroplasma clarkii]|uniref:Competence damage-inducible protein A n=1 Tax=Spiroplasma clarkii TaxID=2139 RepID=A0A1Y0L1W9_9MOLU|nr:nicotinamide-nucleotide amidohydrolase family protein [Spiroplasma clarkii]ARU92012.1 competence damage-inducible protein A [Spiroplasma clarkii]ATX71346.1 competence damage-inducible protein A [Spiroplasma clarkii]